MNCRILLNVRYPSLDYSFRSRPEIDGLIEDEQGLLAIEIKSFPLSRLDMEEILHKYSTLAFRRFILVAPDFPSSKISHAGFDFIKLIPFRPDDSEIWEYYYRWREMLPETDLLRWRECCKEEN
jgi:hypothetical protein